MHRIGPGGERGFDERGAVEVSLRRAGAGQPDGQFRLGHMRGADIWIREDGHRADPSLTAGAENPPGDLAPVGHKQSVDLSHGAHIRTGAQWPRLGRRPAGGRGAGHGPHPEDAEAAGGGWFGRVGGAAVDDG